jgi:multidrug efflux system membrane fusion protein
VALHGSLLVEDAMADEAAPAAPDPKSTPDATAAPAGPRRGRRLLLWLVALVVLIGAGIAATTWWREHRQREQTAKAPPPIPVVTSVARKGNIDVFVTGLGTVTPLNTVAVKTRVDGQLIAVGYKEGEMVARGAPLLEIDPRPYEVQLAQAEAQLSRDQSTLANARVDLQRYEALITHNAVAQQVLQTQRATVAQDEGTVKSDQANIDSAKLNITYCHIVAPITGRVGLRLVDAGNMVTAASGTPLLVIVQTQPISVIFTIPEQQVGAVRAALKRDNRLRVDAFDRDGQQKLASGELTTLDNEIDQTTGTLKLRATMANRDEALFPNQFLNARLLVETKKGVTLVPGAAIQRNADATFVFVVKPNRSVTLRNVKVGTSEGDNTEVVSGLSPDDVVVTQGTDKLQEGSVVSPASQEDDDVGDNAAPHPSRAAASRPAQAPGAADPRP